MFDKPGPDDDTPQAMPERYLNLFFQTLEIPYRPYQAENPRQVEEAIHANEFEKQVPSQAALRTQMALKLAGLVTFVASSCPEIKADYTHFKATLNTLGVRYDDLAKTEMKNVYLGYTMRYKEATKDNCARALVNFGPGGKTVPDIFKVTITS